MNDVVVGSGFEAVKFAAKNGCVLLCPDVKDDKPEPFEYCDDTLIDIYGDCSRKIEKPEGPEIVGPQKMRIWEHLIFVLSYHGLTPVHGFNDVTLRFDNNKKISILISGSKVDEVVFDKLYIFSPDKLKNCPGLGDVKYEKRYYVLDDYKVFESKIPYDELNFDEDFVKNLYLHKSTTGTTSLVSESILTTEQFQDPEYSSTFAQFIIEDELDQFEYSKISKEGRRSKVIYDLENLKDTEDIQFFYNQEIKLEKSQNIYPKLKSTLFFLLHNKAINAEHIL